MSHLTYQGQRVNFTSCRVENNGELYVFHFVDRAGVPRRLQVAKAQVPATYFSKNEIAKQQALQHMLDSHELVSFLLG